MIQTSAYALDDIDGEDEDEGNNDDEEQSSSFEM